MPLSRFVSAMTHNMVVALLGVSCATVPLTSCNYCVYFLLSLIGQETGKYIGLELVQFPIHLKKCHSIIYIYMVHSEANDKLSYYRNKVNLHKFILTFRLVIDGA